MTRTGARSALPEDRWFTLLLMSRLLGAAVALGLLVVHRVTDHDALLVALGAAWTAVSLGAFGRFRRLRASAVAWAADGLAALGLVLSSGDWRSPFYLVLSRRSSCPARACLPRGALERSPSRPVGATSRSRSHTSSRPTIENTLRLETLLRRTWPFRCMITLAARYAAALLVRASRSERARSERLAVQTERRRIAWELHDSAKQRVTRRTCCSARSTAG